MPRLGTRVQTSEDAAGCQNETATIPGVGLRESNHEAPDGFAGYRSPVLGPHDSFVLKIHLAGPLSVDASGSGSGSGSGSALLLALLRASQRALAARSALSLRASHSRADRL